MNISLPAIELMYSYLQNKVGDFEQFAGYVGEFLTAITPG